MKNCIFHCDLNGFFASVECAINPAIKHLPVAVGGDLEARHGIILAKNNVAKKYNIKTGEALWQARQKCPQLHIVKPRNARYIEYSRAAREIYLDYTDRVESFGIDECWLDISATGLLRGDNSGKIADEIRRRIYGELGITCSIGVSWNKIFAKLGSDYKKPDAVTVINADNYQQIVWDLPVEDLFYVGPATRRKLRRIGIYTIGGLARLDKTFLRSFLGKNGDMLHDFANGKDYSEVHSNDFSAVIKSVGNSTTCPYDLTDNTDVKRIFYMLADSVAGRLRKHGFRSTLLQIYIRDKDLEHFERQEPLPAPSCLTHELATAAYRLFLASYDWRKPIRSLGVRAAKLVPLDSACQYDLFGAEEQRERHESLERCIDEIRARYGSESITRALLIKERTKITANKGAPTFNNSMEISRADWDSISH